ncbi:DMT family transporter [Vibrio salinus]|uniref:DMT family transporter n=1 Tax=Vibrio salinus TaxID=2899784 RepID=UPI001E33FE6C|nr:DMT family transporter [Vibrio salinus]MCE0495237.1 DMT family transporter [Vibrio salinus]
MSGSMRYFCYGLFFSFTTVLFWGLIPIALKVSGGFADPVTLTWLRFSVSGLIVLVWQWAHGRLHEFLHLSRMDWVKLLLTGVFLIINYTCFAWGLNYLRPEVAQLGMQVAPLFLALGGMIFLKEKIASLQWVCFAILIFGLVIFFHPVVSGDYHGDLSVLFSGLIIMLVAALSWSAYALVQKSLYQKLNSSNILLGIYLFALIAMVPATHPSQLMSMTTSDVWVAIFCCLNTVIAYGSFAQALCYWETVQVSAVITLTPVASYLLTELCVFLGWWSDIITPSHADFLSLSGMAIVILAAIGIQVVSVLGIRHRKRSRVQTAA